jgi:hypothetical protein
MVDGQRREWWCEGRPDLRWRTTGKGASQRSLRTQVRLLDADLPGTRPHLNSVGPGVEVGGSRTLGGIGVGGGTATTAAASTVVAVILLLAGLLRLLLLRLLLVLLMSWWAFLPTGGGRGQCRLLRSVEGGGAGGSDRQPLNFLKSWTPHSGRILNGSDQASRRRWSRTHVPILQKPACA